MIAEHNEYVKWFMSLNVGDMVGYTNVYYVKGLRLFTPSKEHPTIFFKITEVQEIPSQGVVTVDGVNIPINLAPNGIFTEDGIIMPVEDMNDAIVETLS